MTPQELEIMVVEKIKEVYDPEIPVNVYELGLIYDVSITQANEVVVLMTLTAPNCPEAGGIPIEIEEKIKELPEVTKVKTILTFNPPWEMSMMTDEAKLELGLF
jgi:FeS assembly SUF system protein